MNFDIAIFYREDMPEQMVLDLVQDLRDANVNVETEKRPNEPVAMPRMFRAASSAPLILPRAASSPFKFEAKRRVTMA